MFNFPKKKQTFNKIVLNEAKQRGHELQPRDYMEYFESLNGNFISLEPSPTMTLWQISHIMRLKQIYQKKNWWYDFLVIVENKKKHFLENQLIFQSRIKKIFIHCYNQGLKQPTKWFQLAEMNESIVDFQLLPPPVGSWQSFDPDFLHWSGKNITKFALQNRKIKDSYKVGIAASQMNKRQKFMWYCYVFYHLVENWGWSYINDLIHRGQCDDQTAYTTIQKQFNIIQNQLLQQQQKMNTVILLPYFIEYYKYLRRCPSLNCNGSILMVYDTQSFPRQNHIGLIPQPVRSHEMLVRSWHGASNYHDQPQFTWLDFDVKIDEYDNVVLDRLNDELVESLPFLRVYKKIHFDIIQSDQSSPPLRVIGYDGDHPPVTYGVYKGEYVKPQNGIIVNDCRQNQNDDQISDSGSEEQYQPNPINQMEQKLQIQQKDQNDFEVRKNKQIKKRPKLPKIPTPASFKRPPSNHKNDYKLKDDDSYREEVIQPTKTIILQNNNIPIHPPSKNSKKNISGFISLYRHSTDRTICYCTECEVQFGFTNGNKHTKHPRQTNQFHMIQRYDNIPKSIKSLEQITAYKSKIIGEIKNRNAEIYNYILVNEKPKPCYRVVFDGQIKIGCTGSGVVYAHQLIIAGTCFGFVGGQLLTEETIRKFFPPRKIDKMVKINDKYLTTMQTMTQLSTVQLAWSSNCKLLECVHEKQGKYVLVLKATSNITPLTSITLPILGL